MKLQKTMKAFLCYAFLFLSGLSAGAQNFMRHYDHSGLVKYEPTTNRYTFFGNIAPVTIAGMTNTDFAGPHSRISLSILDNQLNTLWLKTYATQTEVGIATSPQTCHKLTTDFYCNDVIKTSDGGYVICGISMQNSERTSCTVPYYQHPFLLKTNASGAVLWYKRYNVNNGGFSAVVEDPVTKRLIACGNTTSGPYGEGLIVCTDLNGNVLGSIESVVPDPYFGANLRTGYGRIIPFTGRDGNDYFALSGNTDQGGMGIDGGILITIIDINGTVHKSTFLSQNTYNILPQAYGLADAGNGDLVLTGSSIDASGGYPCGSDLSSSLLIIKYEPFSETVHFFKDYNKTPYTPSYGNDIKVGPYGAGSRYCVAAQYADRAVYLETNESGTVLRYTLHNPADAKQSRAMTMNSAGSYPVYSGGSPAGPFVVRNNFGTDCGPDIEVPVDDLPLNTSPATNNSYPVTAISEVMLAYSMPFNETDVCGVNDPETPCSADFMYQSYSFNPKVVEVFPLTPFAGATYMVNWGDGGGFVPVISSHLYAPGNYTICVKEYRDGVEFCTRCKDICIGSSVTSSPDSVSCDFIFRSYSNTGNTLEVIPVLMPSGATIYDYVVNWGDGSTPGAPVSSHTYATTGSYPVCLARYAGGVKVCERCISVCIGGGGFGFGRIISEPATLTNAEGSTLYPNPAVDEATLSFSITAEEEQVEAIVTDMTGRQVQTLFNGSLKKGAHKLQLRTDKLPNAVYHVKVRIGQTTKVHRLSVLK